MSGNLRRAILDRADAEQVQEIAAREKGYASLRTCAESLIAQDLTNQAEVERVLGMMG